MMQGTQEQREWQDIVTRAIARAWQDPRYRELLVADPAQALREMGARLDGSARIVTVEDTSDTVHFVLPTPPAQLFSLSDGDLITAAAEKTVYQHEMQWLR